MAEPRDPEERLNEEGYRALGYDVGASSAARSPEHDNTTVERVARAIYDSLTVSGAPGWDSALVPRDDRSAFRAAARAALASTAARNLESDSENPSSATTADTEVCRASGDHPAPEAPAPSPEEPS